MKDWEEDEYTYWEWFHYHNPEQTKKWKAEQKAIPKNNIVIAIEEDVHWKGGSFKVFNADHHSDECGIYWRDVDGEYRKIRQISIWDKWGTTKLAINLNSKFQVVQDDE